MSTTILYRPVGRKELDLIRASGYMAFPPRLSFQPIFYPVLTREYAEQIARDWNTKDAASDYIGYVTRFEVRNEFLDRYEPKVVRRSDVASRLMRFVFKQEFENSLQVPLHPKQGGI